MEAFDHRPAIECSRATKREGNKTLACQSLFEEEYKSCGIKDANRHAGKSCLCGKSKRIAIEYGDDARTRHLGTNGKRFFFRPA